MFIIEQSACGRGGAGIARKPYDHGMPNLGPAELLVLLTVILALAGIVALALRTGGRPEARLAWRHAGLPAISAELWDRVRALTDQNRKIEAVKLIREETGLDLREAKRLMDAIASGRPYPRPPIPQPDLATRVRELKAAGRVEQAIFLIRGETGMGQAEAEAFLNAL